MPLASGFKTLNRYQWMALLLFIVGLTLGLSFIAHGAANHWNQLLIDIDLGLWVSTVSLLSLCAVLFWVDRWTPTAKIAPTIPITLNEETIPRGDQAQSLFALITSNIEQLRIIQPNEILAKKNFDSRFQYCRKIDHDHPSDENMSFMLSLLSDLQTEYLTILGKPEQIKEQIQLLQQNLTKTEAMLRTLDKKRHPDMRYAIGLMSGTSMDGIDIALLKTDGTPHLLESLHHDFFPYDARFSLLLKAAEYAVRQQRGAVESAKIEFDVDGGLLNNFLCQTLNLTDAVADYKLAELKTYLDDLRLDNIINHSTELHIRAVERFLSDRGIDPQEVDVVGYHGQTLYHAPKDNQSIIVGNGQVLAARLGIPVVNNFRQNDINNGGQGAPFAPLYHQALISRDQIQRPAAVINCGGIANITIDVDGEPTSILGFDTGPGNALIDSIVRQKTQGLEQMDKDGQYAKQGELNQAALVDLINQSMPQDFLKKPPPKSLDYGDIQVPASFSALSLEDACRTSAEFTAQTIVDSFDFAPGVTPNTVILAGGGWKNPIITTRLKALLSKKFPGILIQQASEVGWHNDALEAEIFASFAVRSLKGLPLSYPNITGVSKALSGGNRHDPSPG